MAAETTRFARFMGSDLVYSFRRSPVAMVSLVLLLVLITRRFSPADRAAEPA